MPEETFSETLDVWRDASILVKSCLAFAPEDDGQ